MAAREYRVNTYTNTVTAAVWYFLETSTDAGVTWQRVNAGAAAAWAATGGWIASQTEATVVAVMNTLHAKAIADLSDLSIWTVGPVVAGPV